MKGGEEEEGGGGWEDAQEQGCLDPPGDAGKVPAHCGGEKSGLGCGERGRRLAVCFLKTPPLVFRNVPPFFFNLLNRGEPESCAAGSHREEQNPPGSSGLGEEISQQHQL